MTAADEEKCGSSYPWVSWLPRIMFALNMQKSDMTGETPYELVFGQVPRGNIFPCARTGVVKKEDSIDVRVSEPYQPVPAPRKKMSDTALNIPDVSREVPEVTSEVPEVTIEVTSTFIDLPEDDNEGPDMTGTGVPSIESEVTSEVASEVPEVSDTGVPIIDASEVPKITSEVPKASMDLPEDVSEMPGTVIEALDDEIQEVLDVNATRKQTASTSPPNHRAKKKREAFRATETSTAKMKSMYLRKHGQNIRTFHVGDTVTIPKLDRTSTDQQRLPC